MDAGLFSSLACLIACANTTEAREYLPRRPYSVAKWEDV